MNRAAQKQNVGQTYTKIAKAPKYTLEKHESKLTPTLEVIKTHHEITNTNQRWATTPSNSETATSRGKTTPRQHAQMEKKQQLQKHLIYPKILFCLQVFHFSHSLSIVSLIQVYLWRTPIISNSIRLSWAN